MGNTMNKVLICPFVKGFGYSCVLWECGSWSRVPWGDEQVFASLGLIVQRASVM